MIKKNLKSIAENIHHSHHQTIENCGGSEFANCDNKNEGNELSALHEDETKTLKAHLT
jgi:hypothetical protein